MIQIKEAGIESLDIIKMLAYKIWPSAYTELLEAGQLDYMLNKFYSIHSLQNQSSVLKHQFIIVFEDEAPVGFASFSAHKEDPTVYHLNKIYVLPAKQGKNIGRQILDYVTDRIKSGGACTLQLNVNRKNKASFFYEKYGFKIIREEDIDIGEGYFMNDYVMELKL
ncbi:MAG: GNAT family N-acetyltransferase [Ginsengibacter sp.]